MYCSTVLLAKTQLSMWLHHSMLPRAPWLDKVSCLHANDAVSYKQLPMLPHMHLPPGPKQPSQVAAWPMGP
jgi:hypothetical protein